jgi:hypothetical protein
MKTEDMNTMTSFSLGNEVIAILQDGSARALGVIAEEMLHEACSTEDLQSELDGLVVDGAVKRHFVADCWLYQLKVEA